MTKKSDAPAIRFKGFSDAWEQRKLGEIGSVSMCRRIFKEQTSETGDIPFYKIGTFGADPDAFISRELFEEYKSKYPYPQKGDILISASGSIGRTVEFAGNNEYFQDSNIVWLNHDERLSNPFLKCFYSVVKWAGIEGSTIKRLYNDNILNTVICMPSVPEQKRIGLFFENLDNLITLHQRKCVFLFGFFQAFISMIFTASTFSWEQRKLGELVDRVVRKNINNESTLPLTISAQYGLVDQITYFNNRVASRDVSNYYLVLNGEFAYNKSTSDGYPFGAVKRLDLYEKGVLSTLYIVFAPKKEQQIDSDYLTVFFDTDRWHKGVAERAAEGARNHGLLNISAEDFFDIDLSVPKDIVEQKQIGAFIRQLDNLITLHQRECISFTARAGRLILTANKKRNTSSWEQRKLGDVVKEITRNDPESEAPIMMITANNGFIEQSERYAFNNAGESLKKYILLKKGELAYNHGASKLRPYGSCFALTTAENARIPFVYHCFSAENQNAEFMSIELNGAEIENQLRKIVSSGARMDGLLNISFDEYTSVSVILPGTEEQDRIADFFRHLDNLITLHQRKFEKLTNVKKSMLEKMFPQNGSSYPEIRFKGFTDPWEQRKVQDVADRFDNLRIPVAANLRVHGTTPYYGANGIQDYVEGFTHDGEFVLVAEDGANDLKNYPVKCVNGRIWVNNHAHILQGKAGIADNSFLAFAISQSDIESLLVGGGRAKLNAETLMSIEFRLPCLQEQYRIGEYLTQLDHLITLHQRELEKLQNIKKSMLEKMFV